MPLVHEASYINETIFAKELIQNRWISLYATYKNKQ